MTDNKTQKAQHPPRSNPGNQKNIGRKSGGAKARTLTYGDKDGGMKGEADQAPRSLE